MDDQGGVISGCVDRHTQPRRAFTKRRGVGDHVFAGGLAVGGKTRPTRSSACRSTRGRGRSGIRIASVNPPSIAGPSRLPGRSRRFVPVPPVRAEYQLVPSRSSRYQWRALIMLRSMVRFHLAPQNPDRRPFFLARWAQQDRAVVVRSHSVWHDRVTESACACRFTARWWLIPEAPRGVTPSPRLLCGSPGSASVAATTATMSSASINPSAPSPVGTAMAPSTWHRRPGTKKSRISAA